MSGVSPLLTTMSMTVLGTGFSRPFYMKMDGERLGRFLYRDG